MSHTIGLKNVSKLIFPHLTTNERERGENNLFSLLASQFMSLQVLVVIVAVAVAAVIVVAVTVVAAAVVVILLIIAATLVIIVASKFHCRGLEVI